MRDPLHPQASQPKAGKLHAPPPLLCRQDEAGHLVLSWAGFGAKTWTLHRGTVIDDFQAAERIASGSDPGCCAWTDHSAEAGVVYCYWLTVAAGKGSHAIRLSTLGQRLPPQGKPRLKVAYDPASACFRLDWSGSQVELAQDWTLHSKAPLATEFSRQSGFLQRQTSVRPLQHGVWEFYVTARNAIGTGIPSLTKYYFAQ